MTEFFSLIDGVLAKLRWSYQADNALSGSLPAWTYLLGLFVPLILTYMTYYLVFKKLGPKSKPLSPIEMLKMALSLSFGKFKGKWVNLLFFVLLFGPFVFFSIRIGTGIFRYHYFNQYWQDRDKMSEEYVTVKKVDYSRGYATRRSAAPAHIRLEVETLDGERRKIFVSDARKSDVLLLEQVSPDFQLPVRRNKEGAIVFVDFDHLDYLAN